jgi:outer membrane biosynthesis protein TonB
MTAVMRAMAVNTGPKVLRIGLVHRGRIVEERVIKQRTTVTVGQSEKSMFVVPTPNIPPQFKLFELVGPDYYLNFLDGMTGRVALATGITDIGALRGQAKKVNNAYQVKLTEEARGKVVIGDTTFLFQFVAPPPVQPRPQLPLAVKGGLASQIDWSLTIIAAFSFLLHFGFVGAMYSDWMDRPVGDDSVAGLVDMMKNIPAPPAPEVPPEPTAAPTATSTASKDPTPAKAAGPTGPAGPSKGGPVSNERAAALSQQADQMQMAMLASIAGGPSTKGALDRSEIPPVDLSGAAASNAGVTPGAGDLKFGTGGAPVQGGKNGGLGAIAGSTQGSGTGAGAGTERKVAGPTGDAQVGGTTASVAVSDADRVIASLRPKFKACYQNGLNTDPTMSGKVVISAKIAPTGEVDSANPAENTGLSPAVAACIARAVRNAQFAAPGGTGSTLRIPVTFVQQGK